MHRIASPVRSAAKQGWITIFRSAKRNGALLSCMIGFAALLASVSAVIVPALALNPGTLPTGGRIVSGSGTITSSGNQMTVTQQQNKMIADWATFNIGSNAGVTFIQPNASSTALNMILDQNPSQIFGSLKANGEVFLINPSGIIFGPTARVDVGGLVASSLKLSQEDYFLGNWRFMAGGVAGSVINQGTINTADYGVVALIAPQVSNQGTITAPKGSVALASGNRVSLDFTGDGLIKVSVDKAALNATVANGGAIKADGGRVFMTAQSAGNLMATVVNNTGVIEADSVSEKNGVIVLDGGSQGIVSNSGNITARGNNSGETGGTITVTGDKVGLFAGSNIDASGYAGGGVVNIGGGKHGSNPNIRNANEVYVDPSATITADATNRGNGGTVTVWSERYTNFRGNISAMGGVLGGNGGWVETSSRKVLDALGSVSTLAAMGKPGEWLLDPSDITIVSGNGGSLSNGDFIPTGNSSSIGSETIATGLTSGNVTLDSSGSGNGLGDITVSSSIVTTGNPSGTSTLTLKAYRDINVDPNVTIDTRGEGSDPLNVVLWSNSSGKGGAIVMNPGSGIWSDGGNITLGGGKGTTIGYALGRNNAGDYSNGIALFGAQLNSAGGNITLYGSGANTSGTWQNGTTGAFGVLLSVSDDTNNTIINSGAGAISINGKGRETSGDGYNAGVGLLSGSFTGNATNVTIESTSGHIGITGDAHGVAHSKSTNSTGIVSVGATIQATNGGDIYLNGVGGSGGVSQNSGVYLGGGFILANSGPIQIQGSDGTGANSQGIYCDFPTVGQAQGTSVPSSTSNISLIADTINLNGLFQSSRTLTIQPYTKSTPIGIGLNPGPAATGPLYLSADLFSGINQVFYGFSNIQIGSAGNTGAISIGDASFPCNLTVYNGSGGITVNDSLSATGNITLATTGRFTNNAGADALATGEGARWLVYAHSTDSSLNKPNGITPDFTQYNAPYPTTPQQESGNGFLYSSSLYSPPAPTPTPPPTNQSTQISNTIQAVQSIQAAQTIQTGTQAVQNGTSGIGGDPNKTTVEGTTAEVQTAAASGGASGGPPSGSLAQVVAVSDLMQQGTVSQSKGDYSNSVLNYRQAADTLLQQASLPQAFEAVEMMKTAELQDYYQDADIKGVQEHKTKLKDIPQDTAVICTLIFPQRLDLVLVLKSGIKKFTVPIDSESLSQEINKFRAALQRRTSWDYPAEAKRFYNLIMKPLELELSIHGINTLVFMPDGALRTVPFAALHDGREFLIERYAVVVTPSLALTDVRSIRRKEAKVLSAGLTESVQGFAPLSNVKGELDGIQSIYRSDRLENSTFVAGNVRDGLRDNPYSIVHIATHGNFAPKASDTFLLAWDGKIDMNQLDAIMKQPSVNGAPLELLSLSACETAAGDDKAALGLAGVAVKAGSRSAVATLWSVSDQAASELVLEFYKQLQNPSISKAEALQAAQLKLLDSPNYRHPYYWSPFLLIGNWL